MKAIPIGEATPAELLEELRLRGGTYTALADAALLYERKSQDYNAGVSRDTFFPFGLKSYTQMLHTKTQRLVSLCHAQGAPNFESARDTVLDLINYASFCADWLERTK